jgi:outer membrane immunogenic protein
MGRFACVVPLATTQCSLGLAALAADLPPRMEPVPPVAHVPAFSWTGFYLGGELGSSDCDA